MTQIFSGSWDQRSRSPTTFPTNALFRERHTDQGFTIEDQLICKIFLLISAFLYEVIAVFVFFVWGAKSMVRFCLISVVDVASTLGLSKFQQFCM